jgi:hypothetical protein
LLFISFFPFFTVVVELGVCLPDIEIKSFVLGILELKSADWYNDSRR